MAEPVWQSHHGGASMAEPGNRMYIKIELVLPGAVASGSVVFW